MTRSLIDRIAAAAPDDLLRGSIGVTAAVNTTARRADIVIGDVTVRDVPLAEGVTPVVGQVVLIAKLRAAWLVLAALARGTAPVNLLPNPGFELDTPGTQVPTGWSTDRYTGTGSRGSVGAGRTGVSGFTVPLLGGVTQHLSTVAAIPVTPGRAYRIGVWSRATAPLVPGESLTVQVWPGESPTAAAAPGVTVLTAGPTTAWQEASVIWTAPPASQGTQVWCRLSLVWAGGSSTRGIAVTVDDLSLQEAA